jgi:hypothetical protein
MGGAPAEIVDVNGAAIAGETPEQAARRGRACVAERMWDYFTTDDPELKPVSLSETWSAGK